MTASVREFPPFAVDEPFLSGGTDTGPTPLELVTAGLAACQTVTIAKLADALGFQFSSLAVSAETDVKFRAASGDMGPVPRFSDARMIVNIGTNEPEDRYRLLIKLVEERCPVSRLFSDASMPVQVDWHRA
jgi:uncharacterized OsmC-like protein